MTAIYFFHFKKNENMKRTFLLLILFFSTSLTFAQTDAEIRDYLDFFLVAIGTELPDVTGGIASALGTVPTVTKLALTQKCHTQMQSVEIELQENLYSQKRKLELDELYIRAQAITSALNGDSKPLLDFDKNKEKKIKQREKERKKKRKQEEEDQINISLDLLRTQIDKLKALRAQILEEGRKNLDNINTNLQEVYSILEEDNDNSIILKNYKTITSVFVHKGNQICGEADKLQAKIKDLSNALQDGEAIINDKIDQAKARAANCDTSGDNLFVKTSYQEAKDIFAISKKAKDGAFKYYVDIRIHFKQIEKINTELDSLFAVIKNEPVVVKDKKWQNNINNLLKPIPKYLDELEVGLKVSKDFPDKIQNLIKNIESSKASYRLKAFPKFEAKFNQLISEAKSIKIIYYVVDLTTLSDLFDNYYKYNQAVSLYSSNKRGGKRQSKFKHHSINCFPIESVKKEMDKIEEVFFDELLAIKANKHLSAGCVPTASTTTQEDITDKADATDSGVDPPTIATDTTTSKTPEKSTFGGLAIGGSSKITVGSGTRFVALDGGGDPYPNKGGFTWSTTRQDLLVLSSSGSATAFRAGSAVVILKFQGMTAYKDVKIIPKESSDSEEELTAIESDEEDSVKEKCYNLIDRITISLHSKNVQNARKYTNRALALGCEVNAGAVNGLIAQIEKEKEEEQKEWEEQYAAQDHERQQEADRVNTQRKKQRKQALNNFINFLDENIKNASNIGNRNANKNDSNNQNNNRSNNGNQQNGMSRTSCNKRICPICPSGNPTAINLSKDPPCRKCIKQNKIRIDKCVNGGVSNNQPTHKPNKCGRIIPKEELVELRNSAKSRIESWRHTCGMDYMYGPSGWCHHLTSYLNEGRYEKNVENWKIVFKCVDGCASAYPKSSKDRSNQHYNQFINCIKKCKLVRCKP